MKKILFINIDNINNAPRLWSVYNLLANKYETYVLAKQIIKDPSVKHIQYYNYKPQKWSFHKQYPLIFRKLISFFYRVIYFSYLKKINQSVNEVYPSHKIIKQLAGLNVDIVIAHHMSGLIIAEYLKKKQPGVKVIFNAHEYYPLQFENLENWNQRKKQIDIVLRRVSGIIDYSFIVSEGILKKYEEEFGFKNAVVIRNSKKYTRILPVYSSSEKIKLIHHGASIKSRGIEEMIQMMNYLPGNFELYLMLTVVHKEYYERLKEMTKAYPNVFFLDAVEESEIIPFINQFDIGVYNVKAVNFNHINCLPNKFFDFVQARLAIVVSSSVEMKSYVKKYNLGVVVEDDAALSMANALKQITREKIHEYKRNVDKYAHELSFEYDERIILDLVEKAF